MEQPSNLEKVTGSTLTNSSLTLLSTALGGYAALLPVLTSSFAHERYKERVEKTLDEINSTLKQHEDKIRGLANSQYQFINSSVITLLHTVESEKIGYLKNAILNAVETEINELEETLVSRILRDISASELNFARKIQQYSEIVIFNEPEKFDSNHEQLCVAPNTFEALSIYSLSNLGVYSLHSTGYGGTLHFTQSQIYKKLITIIAKH